MFSRHERLKQRTPEDGIDRPTFLKQLVNEFRTTTSTQNQLQVLANLANFAYDPINYKWLKSLKVVDLFLDQLAESNTHFVQFAIGGLCNFALDPDNVEYLSKSKGINSVINCIFSSDEQTVLSAITILISVLNPGEKNECLTDNVKERLKQLSLSSNLRYKNLATIFLQDYCPDVPLEKKSMIMWCSKVLRKFSSFKGLTVGDKLTTERIFTDNDLEQFASLTGDRNTVHFIKNQSLVHGALLNGLVSAIIGTQLPGPGSILVEEILRFPNPCYVGENVRTTVEVVSIRKIVELKFHCAVDQKIVLSGIAKIMKKD